MEKDTTEEVRGIVMESLRMQVATLNAGITFWQAWVDRAADFAQSASRDLLHLAEPDADVSKVVGRVTDSTRKYLREVTELPNLAAAKFNSEMQTAGRPSGGRRQRAARVKE